MSKSAFIRKFEEQIPFEEKRYYIKPTDNYPTDFDLTAHLKELGIEIPEGYVAIEYHPAKYAIRKFADVPPVDPTPDLVIPTV